MHCVKGSGAGTGQRGNRDFPAAAGVLRRHGGDSVNRQNRFAECVGSCGRVALRSAATAAAEVATNSYGFRIFNKPFL